jgi:hypothetical protein
MPQASVGPALSRVPPRDRAFFAYLLELHSPDDKGDFSNDARISFSCLASSKNREVRMTT